LPLPLVAFFVMVLSWGNAATIVEDRSSIAPGMIGMALIEEEKRGKSSRLKRRVPSVLL
jgi:hypothetical protein